MSGSNLKLPQRTELEARLTRALSELLEQIECLGSIYFSKDLEPYKAEAVWDDTVLRAEKALALAYGEAP